MWPPPAGSTLGREQTSLLRVCSLYTGVGPGPLSAPILVYFYCTCLELDAPFSRNWFLNNNNKCEVRTKPKKRLPLHFIQPLRQVGNMTFSLDTVCPQNIEF